MDSTASPIKRLPISWIVIAAFAVAGLISGIAYLNRPAPKVEEQSVPDEAKAYLPNLQFSDVGMKATENFMKQQVVEIEGKLTNNGSKAIGDIDVYCIFYGVDGKELHRERVPLVRSRAGNAFGPGQVRPFRLPFDNLPEGWNQTMPKLVIARLSFAQQ
jgi:hypothetical protein